MEKNYTKITNDLPFKYVMSHVKEALRIIIEECTFVKSKELTFLSPYIIPNHILGKTTIYDLFLQNENGELFVIEMQNSSLTTALAERIQAYDAQLINFQMEKGKGYEFKKAYCIFLLNNDDPSDMLIDRNYLKNEQNAIFPKNLVNVFLVHLNFINTILQNKSLYQLTSFERIIYALKYDLDDAILKLGERVINDLAYYKNGFIKIKDSFISDEKRAWLDEHDRILNEKEHQAEVERYKEALEKQKQESEQHKMESEQLKVESEQLKVESEQLKLESEQRKLENEIYIRNIMEAYHLNYDDAKAFLSNPVTFTQKKSVWNRIKGWLHR